MGGESATKRRWNLPHSSALPMTDDQRERFLCHHESALDMETVGEFLAAIGSAGVVAGIMGIRTHDDPGAASSSSPAAALAR